MEYKWEREAVEKLIIYVQENTCLYNVHFSECMDRAKKAPAFTDIHKKLETEMVGVTLDDVKKNGKTSVANL